MNTFTRKSINNEEDTTHVCKVGGCFLHQLTETATLDFFLSEENATKQIETVHSNKLLLHRD